MYTRKFTAELCAQVGFGVASLPAATGGAEKGDHEELGRRAAADRSTEKVDVELIGKWYPILHPKMISTVASDVLYKYLNDCNWML